MPEEVTLFCFFARERFSDTDICDKSIFRMLHRYFLITVQYEANVEICTTFDDEHHFLNAHVNRISRRMTCSKSRFL